MSYLILHKLTVSKALLSCILVFVFGVSCNRQPPATTEAPKYDEQGRLLLISEAQQAFGEAYKAGFNAEKTQLLVGPELKRFLDDKKKSLNLAPESAMTAIANNQGVGLLINDAVPGKQGGMHGVVYLRPARFGAPRFFLTLDPDPCGDGNPATCENCTGCSGIGRDGGIFHTCVCTESCDNCRTCPAC